MRAVGKLQSYTFRLCIVTMADGINQQEEKELKRVFDHLQNYTMRTKFEIQLAPKVKKMANIEAHRQNPDEIKVIDDDTNNQLSETQIEALSNQLTSEIRSLEDKIKKYTAPPNAPANSIFKISDKDMKNALEAMGKSFNREEIQKMIWEVDDNLDGKVDWDEFRLAFHRNITDDTGLECSTFFNIVQFMTYDKTFSGSVTVDDTMSMLYARFGRDQLETQMRKLFGTDAGSADGGGSLTMNDYLKAVSKKEIKPRGLVECKRK